MEKVTKLIVETFEKEQPDFCYSIKLAVASGEDRATFIKFIKGVFKTEYETSVTAQLAITCFDYYKNKP